MKQWPMGLLLLVLTGCSQTPLLEPLQATEPIIEDVSISCVMQLSQSDTQALHSYVHAFKACKEPIVEKDLVLRYVRALIAIGHYQELINGTAFHENVDAGLAQGWTLWANEVLE